MALFRYIGYAAFFLVWLVIGLYLTFPWDVAKDRLFAMAHKQSGVRIKADSFEPDWITGIEAKKVKIWPKDAKDPIELDQLNARAKVLSFLTGKKGVTAEIPFARGKVTADVEASDTTVDIEAKVEKIQLELVPATQNEETKIGGRLSVDADLIWGLKDPKATDGTAKITINELVIGKGTKLGMFGLPRDFDMGNVVLDLPIKKGKINIKNTRIAGKDIEIEVNGDITLGKPAARSRLNLQVSLKPTAALLKSDPLIKSLLRNVQRFKSPDGSYGYAVTGTLKRPNFRPKKR